MCSQPDLITHANRIHTQTVTPALYFAHHYVPVDINATASIADYFSDRFPRKGSMTVDCHDDCNVVSKRTNMWFN